MRRHFRETNRQSDRGQSKLQPRRGKSDKRVDGNSSLSLFSHPWKDRCAADTNKASLDGGWHKDLFFSCGNGCCAEAGDGFKSLTLQLLRFQWPQWNCSRWNGDQSADIWMTVCLVVRHNHQLSDLVEGVSQSHAQFDSFVFLSLHVLNIANVLFASI